MLRTIAIEGYRSVLEREPSNAWDRWVAAYVQTFSDWVWHSRLALALAQQALPAVPTGKFSLEQVREQARLSNYGRWSEIYDWALFLSQHPHAVPGSCVVATLEGTRPLLVEIQALVDAAHAPNPRRLSVGLEQNRLAMLLAVLHRHAGIATWEQDVFVNAVGGVRIGEPAADLAVSLAVVSSLSDRAIPEKVVVFGEIGLAGEVRPAPRGQDRLKEAAKLGFEKAIVPRANQPKAKISGLEVMAVERVDQAVQLLRNRATTCVLLTTGSKSESAPPNTSATTCS